MIVVPKLIVVMAFYFLSIGCSSYSYEYDFAQKEDIYIKTKNYRDLISLYKNKLSIDDSLEYREKLSEVYLDYGDPEAAILLLEKIYRDSPLKTTALILSNAYLEIGKSKMALDLALNVYHTYGVDAEVENLLGIIYVTEKRYSDARDFFLLSKEHFFDDIKVNNNIAMLDIIEGNYNDAYDRLIKLYALESLDESITTNLILTLSKMDRLDEIKRLYSNKYSYHQIEQLFYYYRSLSVS